MERFVFSLGTFIGTVDVLLTKFNMFPFILISQPAPPFKTLHVRVRSQVVADGLDDPLDWDKAGYGT
jgi:predicted sulfurtransferase